MLDQIEGVLSQIPSKLGLHFKLPTYKSTVMPSLQDYELLSPLLIFLAYDEIENNIMLVIPSKRDLDHPNVGTSLLHVKLYIPALFVVRLSQNSLPFLDDLGISQWLI
jgi:hypothetical protein